MSKVTSTTPEEADEDSQLPANDPEEYSTQRRLRAIMDARDRVLEKRRDVDRMLAENRYSEAQANTIFRHAVEDYIVEVEYLIRQSDSKDYYWDGEGIGDRDPLLIGVEKGPVAGTAKRFWGLRSIIEEDDPMQFHWEEMTDHFIEGKTPKQRSEHIQIDRSILMNAYRTVNEFLHEVDLDIDFDDTDEDARFDYSDLLEPGEDDPREDGA